MSKTDRLNTEDEFPQLRKPDDLDNPSPEYAPFALEEARPLSQALGDYLTHPGLAGDDANADVVLQHSRNAELTVWIARFSSEKGTAYIMTCWGIHHEMHFDVPKDTVADVIEQAADDICWTLDIVDDDLRERFVDAL